MAFRNNKSSGPPPGYVPGLGRGAVGFQTRSDVGSTAVGTDGTQSRAAEARKALQKSEEESKVVYDQDDDEADEIWEAIDERMNNKRKRTEETQVVSANHQIGSQFRALKEKLADVSEEQWAAIPDVGDYSLKYKQKRRRQDNLTGITDSLIESRNLANLDVTAGNRKLAANTAVDGTTTTATNMGGLSAARETVLGISLDKMETGNQTSVDATGYLTSLSSVKVATATEIGDITKARLLLKSVRDTNPRHGPGWIASARVEEAAGKTLQARKIIQEGCQICADNEDVWLEAARLHPVEVAKSILAMAVRRIPTSVKIFLKAADLESTKNAKKAVLRKALENNPTSVTLWKAAIELEEIEDARVLLSVAVEKIPHSVEMWLALARLETYQNAQKVLNKARKALPTDRSIWIAAAKLEESQNNIQNVLKVVERAVKSLAKHEAAVTRAQWIQEAEGAEASGAPETSAAIVKFTISQDVDERDQLRTWSEDAKAALQKGSVETARAIVAYALEAFPKKRKLWMQSVELERSRGTPESLDDVLVRACRALPSTEIFWLLRAKERWMAGQVDVAREVLTEAFAANPDSEDVWLAAAKLEWESDEIERARVLLQRARDKAPNSRVWLKSAVLEREQKQYGEALQLLEQGICLFPKAAKLYMMGGQICSDNLDKKKSSLERARKFYQRGLEKCPNNSVLWKLTSQLEEHAHTFEGSSTTDAAAAATKARSILELARLNCPKNDDIWLEAVRLERRQNGHSKLAETLMARALQECPNSGALLSENILTAPRVEQKSKSADAIKRCPDDPRVICAVANLFASERKTEKARKWFNRAILLNPDLGDSWARYYAFEVDSDKRAEIMRRCIETEPKHGEIWAPIMKEDRKRTVAEGLEIAAQVVIKNAAAQDHV